MAIGNRKNTMPGKPKISGCLYRAPKGTALPTNETTALAAAYKNMGYLEAKGFKRAIKRAFQSIKAYGGDEVENLRTEHSVSLEFGLIEVLNPDVLKAKYGTDVSTTVATATAGTKTAIAYTGAEQEEAVWVGEFAYKGKVRRLVFPIVQDITDDFTEEYKDDAIIVYPHKMAVYPNDSGVYFFDYYDDGVKLGA